MPFKPVKIGIIGCGSTSGPYLSRLKKHTVVEIYACADIEIYRAEARAEQYKIPRVYTVDELLQDKKIQLVLNLTPPAVHARINLAILRSGKHLYSEKPLGLTRQEAQELLTEAQDRQLLIGCAPDTFLGGGLQTCRSLIDSGAIGDPIAATAFMASGGHESWHPAPESFYQAGGGPMIDMGSYYLSALLHLLGPVARVCGSARISVPERTITSAARRGSKFPAQIPTHYSGVVDFACGAIGTILQSFDIPVHHLPSIEIYGTKGTLCVPDPTCYDGPVQLRKADQRDWTTVELTHSKEVGRGIGLVDMAYAIIFRRRHRANEQLAVHLLDILLAFEESSNSGSHILIESPLERPKPLAPGIKPGEPDLE